MNTTFQTTDRTQRRVSVAIPRPRLAGIIFAWVLVSLVGRSSSAAELQPGKRWALLIGVNQYVSMRSLDYCVSDMQALADQLGKCGFPEDQIYVLRDGSDNVGRLPSKLNIERRLALMLSLVKEKDLVLVAFSGHGVQMGAKRFWCPTEADVERPDETMVSLEGVYAQLEACPAALRLLIVDACRNDPTRDRSGEGIRLDAKNLEDPPEGILLFNSCGPREKSKEDETLGHGVFSHYVLEGLRGAADVDGDRKVSLGELWEFAGDKTKKHVGDKFNDFQQPRLNGELTAETLRYTLATVGASAAPPPAVARPAMTPSTPSTPQPVGPALPIPANLESTTNSVGMRLILIPAGEFQMGSPSYDSDASSDEKPQHRVRITKPFYLGQTEVTQGQWQTVMGGTPWKGESYVQEGPDYPATYVSYDDALDFCRKLSEKDGKSYRLPTEAEWEYACRAGTTTKYSFGDGEGSLGEYAWYDGNADSIGEEYAHQVGRKRPNAWGLYDMHGNVWEWCHDGYDAEFYKTSRVDDPWVAGGSSRVFRGGGWSGTPAYCRSAYRFRSTPSTRNSSLGFRVALVP